MDRIDGDVKVEKKIVMKGDKLYDFPEEYLEIIGQDWDPDESSLEEVVEQVKKQSKILSGIEEEKESQEI